MTNSAAGYSTIQKTYEDTINLGKQIGEICEGGEILLLSGNLGAGKTCFTKGLAKGLGIGDDTQITSPTFVLHCQYQGRLELNHIDAYRLEGAGNVSGLGFDELLGADWGVAAVEWSEFIGELIPEDHIKIDIEILDDDSRKFTFMPTGKAHSGFLDKIIKLNP